MKPALLVAKSIAVMITVCGHATASTTPTTNTTSTAGLLSGLHDATFSYNGGYFSFEVGDIDPGLTFGHGFLAPGSGAGARFDFWLALDGVVDGTGIEGGGGVSPTEPDYRVPTGNDTFLGSLVVSEDGIDQYMSGHGLDIDSFAVTGMNLTNYTGAGADGAICAYGRVFEIETPAAGHWYYVSACEVLRDVSVSGTSPNHISIGRFEGFLSLDPIDGTPWSFKITGASTTSSSSTSTTSSSSTSSTTTTTTTSTSSETTTTSSTTSTTTTTTSTSTTTTSSTSTTTTSTTTSSTTTSSTTTSSTTTTSTSTSTVPPPTIVGFNTNVTLWAINASTGTFAPSFATNLRSVPIEWLTIPDYSNAHMCGTNVFAFDNPASNAVNVFFRLDDVTPSVPIDVADLMITKDVDIPVPTVHMHVTFEVVVSNTGPGNAIGVVVMDEPLSDWVFFNFSPSQGSMSGACWTVGHVNEQSSATLLISGFALTAGVYTNLAQIAAAA